MDGYELDCCSSLLVAKPPCYGSNGLSSKLKSDEETRALRCSERGYDVSKERPHLREIVDVIKERNSKVEHPLFTESMISGYGGFVPNQHSQVGKTFTESCIRSIGEMETGNMAQHKSMFERKEDDDQRHCHWSADIPHPTAKGKKSSSKTSVLLRDFPLYQQTREKQPKGVISPYLMLNDDPLKSYIPGYAGFVPKTMNKFGTYSAMTHQALNEFTDALQQQEKSPC